MFLRSAPIVAALAFLVGAAPEPEPIDWQVVPVLEDGHVTHIDFSLTFSGDEDGETVMNLPDQLGGAA